MSGDKLSIILFFVGTAIAAVMAAFQTAGWRSRAFWAVALIFGVVGLAYWRVAESEQIGFAVRTIWSLAPFIAVAMSLLVVGGREPLKVAPNSNGDSLFKSKTIPVLNAALTSDYFNEIVKSSTELEAKRKIGNHSDQLARLIGEVFDIHEAVYGDHIVAKIAGLTTKYGYYKIDAIEMWFRPDQANELMVIKQGDWIEFSGRPAHGGPFGWRLEECEFLGRVEAPSKPKVRRAAKPRQA